MTEQVSHGQGGGSLHRVFNSATLLHVQSIKNINIPVPTSCFMTTRLQPNVDYFLDSSTSSHWTGTETAKTANSDHSNPLCYIKPPAPKPSRPCSVICRRCQCDKTVDKRLIALCPQVTVKVARIEVRCILGSWSMVPSILVSFFGRLSW